MSCSVRTVSCGGLGFLLNLMVGLAHGQITPIITAISPSPMAPQVASVSIQGSNLQQTGHTTTVTFNGVTVPPADVLATRPEQLTVLVPAGATSGPVVVSVDGADSNAVNFTVVGGSFAPDELVAELIPGGYIGRVLAVSNLDLLDVVPLGRTTLYHLRIPDARSIAQAIRDLFATGLVRTASANFLYQATDLPSQHNQTPPNDLGFGPDQYGPQRIRVVDGKNNTPDAHRLSRGKDVTIAVVDTGVDDAHPDLAAPGKVILGKNYTVPIGHPNRNKPIDDHSHGTHVAGIAAAVTHNREGIAGVAPESPLLAVKVLRATGSGGAAQIANGIRYAARHAKVINLSLGGEIKDPGIEQAVKFAVARKKVVVASSGNGGRLNGPDTPCYPAALSDSKKADGIIAVGNTTEDDVILRGAANPGPNDDPCGFPGGGSTRGDHVDVAAPGTGICSTVPAAVASGPLCVSLPGNRYREKTGTSMAAPHISGVAALMLERDPNLSPTQVECLMRISAVDLGARGKDIEYGDGRVDAYAAVHAVLSLNKRYALLPRDCNAWKPDGVVIDGDGDGDGDGLPPGVLPGVGRPDQVVPITSDSDSTFVATTAGRTIRIDLSDNSVISFPGAPISDVVLTADDQYALVSEFQGVDVDGELKRIRLANNAVDTLVLKPPVTELTVTPNSQKALVGTVEDLALIDIDAFSRQDLDVDAITGISVTPDSSQALVGEPEGVVMVDLGTRALTRLDTSIPITGIPITGDGTKAVVGVPGGVRLITIGPKTFSSFASGTPVSNIALSPDNSKAVYARLSGIVTLDLNTSTVSTVSTPMPVSEVDITPDSSLAIVGTNTGISLIDLTGSSSTPINLPLPTPIQTGLSVSADGKWATLGVPTGIAVIDLINKTAGVVPTALPLTNVSLTPDSLFGVVGTVTGAALINLVSNTATPLSMSRPLIAASISDDSHKAVFGTATGVTVIDIPAATTREISTTPPRLNFLPDDAQPPLNPTGERGTSASTEG